MRRRTLATCLMLAAGTSIFMGCQTSPKEVVQSNPKERAALGNQFPAQFNVAKLSEQEGDYHVARKLYRELLQFRPEHAGTHHRLGIVEIRLGNTEKGLDHLRRAEAVAPENTAILNDLGFACITSGRPEVAEQVLMTALEINPQDERAINNLAMAYGLTGQFDKAFATFRRNLDEAEALSNLGYVATQTGDIKFATECYGRALSLDPQLNEAAEALAQLADLERQVEQRKSIAEATKRNAPTQSSPAIQLTGAQDE